MRAVLMSIQPKWCEKIFSGGKTIEVRKTAPKLETPFKVYVYCTNGRFDITDIYDLTTESVRVVSEGRGKVVGEFVCDKVKKYASYKIYDLLVPQEIDICKVWDKEMTGLTYNELCDYGKGKPLYGWHISDLKIYDKPKELGEFSRYGYQRIEHAESGCGNEQCEYCEPAEVIAGLYKPPMCRKGNCIITRPPKSWCYVEEVER